jgi:hypothetical protein
MAQTQIISESASEVIVGIRKLSLGYLNTFVRLKCAPQMLSLSLFPNAKEITESMGAFHAIRGLLGGPAMGDKTIRCYVVGDGVSPRTGALFAFRTAWQICSIDPNMRNKTTWDVIDRLERYSMTDQAFINLKKEALVYDGLDIVVAVHSHAKFPTMWKALKPPKIGLAMECCVPQKCQSPLIKEFDDFSIHSPKRAIKIWKEG